MYTLSGRRLFKYPEEKAGFELPDKYRSDGDPQADRRTSRTSQRTAVNEHPIHTNKKNGDSDKKDESGGNGDIVVEWYGDDDQENPKNWSLGKKCWVTITISARW